MNKIISFLKENMVATLATSSSDKPRASIVEYFVTEGNSIIFATDPNSIKAQNLSQNAHLSMSVINMPKFVTIDGTVETASEGEIAEYNKVVIERHPEFVEMMQKGIMKPFVYFKVAIDTIYYNDYSSGMTPTEVIKG